MDPTSILFKLPDWIKGIFSCLKSRPSLKFQLEGNSPIEAGYCGGPEGCFPLFNANILVTNDSTKPNTIFSIRIVSLGPIYIPESCSVTFKPNPTRLDGHKAERINLEFHLNYLDKYRLNPPRDIEAVKISFRDQFNRDWPFEFSYQRKP